MRPLLGAGAILALSGWAVAADGAGDAPPGRAESAILITVDTLRADALGFSGNRKASTPVLDRLAAGGRVFSFAHAHAVTTLPSHASMLTGLYPYQHGVRHNGGFVLGEDVPTLASRLSAAGFATAAFVGAFPLDSRFGLDRGFDVYGDDFGEPGSLFQYSERSGDAVVAPALAWWREQRGARRFLWLHLFDPHAPYAPPEPYASRFSDDPYLGEVAAVDAFLAPLLDAFLAGKEAPTLIVFTSDHGEALGEHGEATHGLFAYEPTLAVPLVVWGPGVEPGIDARQARHVDLMPTVLEALSLAPAPALPGRSLLLPAEGHPEVSFFEALSGHLDYGWAPLRGVLEGSDKLIALPIPELYDLGEDPGEAKNRYAERRGEARALARLLPAESSWPPAPGELSAEESARLASLGYLGGPTVEKKRYTSEDDPKTLVALDHKVSRLAELATAGDRARAIAVGREILAVRPTMGLVYVYLSTLLIEAGDSASAIEVMRKAERHGVAGRELRRQLGLTLVNSGRAQEAIDVLEPLAGDDSEARNHLALAYVHRGRFEEAAVILEHLARTDPGEARTWENLSYLAVLEERYAAARDHARRALELDPSLVSSWNNLGIARYHLGAAEAAIEAWNRALTLAPDDADTLLNLGLVAAQTGARETASAALTRFLEVATGPAYEAKRRQARGALKGL